MARLVVVVLLPTPPFPLMTSTTFFTPGSGSPSAIVRLGTSSSQHHNGLDTWERGGHTSNLGSDLLAKLALGATTHRCEGREIEGHFGATVEQALGFHEAELGD